MSSQQIVTRVQTPHAPAPGGPYSQAVVAHGMVHCAGQIARDPVSDMLVAGDIQAQTARVLDNLRAVLEAAGSGLPYVVKTTVFLAHLADAPAMNEVYGHYFGPVLPARSTVEVAALPGDALVEIECSAVVPPHDHPLHRHHHAAREEEFDLESDSDI